MATTPFERAEACLGPVKKTGRNRVVSACFKMRPHQKQPTSYPSKFLGCETPAQFQPRSFFAISAILLP